MLLRVARGMKLSGSGTGGRPLMLPREEASASHPPGSSYWNPAENCCEYGRGRSTYWNVTFCPRFVDSPAVDPMGCSRPPGYTLAGNGSLSDDAGVSPLSSDATTGVCRLNPTAWPFE